MEQLELTLFRLTSDSVNGMEQLKLTLFRQMSGSVNGMEVFEN